MTAALPTRWIHDGLRRLHVLLRRVEVDQPVQALLLDPALVQARSAAAQVLRERLLDR